jgi:hypothetical protein
MILKDLRAKNLNFFGFFWIFCTLNIDLFCRRPFGGEIWCFGVILWLTNGEVWRFFGK